MYIHSFESMAARDGDGIRYCVFLSGCPLRCVYCHNPDTQHRGTRQMTPEELVEKAKRYKPYFKDNGGVTFSGGEPLLQAEELAKTGELLRESGIGYVLDTSLSVPLTEAVKKAINGAQLVLADLKFPTDEMMRRYAGGGLDNVFKALDYIKSVKKRVIIRTVVVPGINDSENILSQYISTIEGISPEYWELLPFHTMGFFKYEESGTENPLSDTCAMSLTVLDDLKSALRQKTSIVIH